MKKGPFAIEIIFEIRRRDNRASESRNFELLGHTPQSGRCPPPQQTVDSDRISRTPRDGMGVTGTRAFPKFNSFVRNDDWGDFPTSPCRIFRFRIARLTGLARGPHLITLARVKQRKECSCGDRTSDQHQVSGTAGQRKSPKEGRGALL